MVLFVVLFPVALRPNAGHGLLLLEVSRSHAMTHHSDQLVAETSTWQHTTLTTDKHPCPRWDSNPRSQQASGRRPRGYAFCALTTQILHADWWILFINRKDADWRMTRSEEEDGIVVRKELKCWYLLSIIIGLRLVLLDALSSVFGSISFKRWVYVSQWDIVGCWFPFNVRLIPRNSVDMYICIRT